MIRCRGASNHHLRLAFGEITEVVPWTICAMDCGQRLEDEQIAAPRLYKVRRA
jgi:hypothetical protein